MTLDVRTMYIAMAATCLIVAAALSATGDIGKSRQDGMLLWALGWAIQGVALIFLGLHGCLWDFSRSCFSASSFTASYSLMYAAVRQFQGRAYNRWALSFPAAATLIFFWYFSAVADKISYRNVFVWPSVSCSSAQLPGCCFTKPLRVKGALIGSPALPSYWLVFSGSTG